MASVMNAAHEGTTLRQDALHDESRRLLRRRDLSLLPTVPLDVLLEVLLLLEPKDLITMARASKTFRRALINEDMDKNVWKHKRQEFGAPDPPPGFSEAKWVAFLFSSFCYNCATPNVLTDFFLLKRACVACKRANYIPQYSINADLDEQLLDGVPFTGDGPTARDRGNGSYCWKSEIEEVVSKWNMYQELDMQGFPDAMEQFTNYWQGRIEYVHWIQENGQACYDWAEALQQRRLQDRDYINQMRAETVRRHFYEQGYEVIDVDAVIHPGAPEIKGTTETITPRVMRNIESKVEPEIIHARDARMYGLKLDLMDARMELLRPLWQQWIASLGVSTAEVLTYPPERFFAELPGVVSLLEAGPEVPVTQESFYHVAQAFPQIVEAYRDVTRRDLLSQLPFSKYASPLELATSVFAPPPNIYSDLNDEGPNGLVIGWKMHSVYHGWAPDEVAQELEFMVERQCVGEYIEELSHLAASLVRMCGRDSRGCTAEDMDRIDKRFLCRECMKSALRMRLGSQVDVDGNIGPASIDVEAFTWRRALSHAWTKHPDSIPQLTFTLLEEPALVRQVCEVERLARERQQMCLSAWFCNHCYAINQNGPTPMGVVNTHLREVHDIQNPGSSDLVFSERHRFHVEHPSKVHMIYERSETMRSSR